jgi:hypothetical protein
MWMRPPIEPEIPPGDQKIGTARTRTDLRAGQQKNDTCRVPLASEFMRKAASCLPPKEKL